MDANCTRYHLLLGHDDWFAGAEGTCPPGSVYYDPVREEVTLRPENFRFTAGRGDLAPRPEDRRGAAIDRYGSVYWIADSESAVRVQSAGSGLVSVFSEPGVGDARAAARTRNRPAGGFGPATDGGVSKVSQVGQARLAGLAVTEDHYLVVGTTDPAGLLVFDLHAPAPPRWELWPADIPLVPFDLCARSGGGVFVLDREHRRLWELDRHLQVVSRGDPPGSAWL